jgi:hypothetical protein
MRQKWLAALHGAAPGWLTAAAKVLNVCLDP